MGSTALNGSSATGASRRRCQRRAPGRALSLDAAARLRPARQQARGRRRGGTRRPQPHRRPRRPAPFKGPRSHAPTSSRGSSELPRSWDDADRAAQGSRFPPSRLAAEPDLARVRRLPARSSRSSVDFPEPQTRPRSQGRGPRGPGGESIKRIRGTQRHGRSPGADERAGRRPSEREHGGREPSPPPPAPTAARPRPARGSPRAPAPRGPPRRRAGLRRPCPSDEHHARARRPRPPLGGRR